MIADLLFVGASYWKLWSAGWVYMQFVGTEPLSPENVGRVIDLSTGNTLSTQNGLLRNAPRTMKVRVVAVHGKWARLERLLPEGFPKRVSATMGGRVCEVRRIGRRRALIDEMVVTLDELHRIFHVVGGCADGA